MKLGVLVKSLGFRLIHAAADEDKEIKNVYAGDRMSDLLSAATDECLIITHLTNHGIVRLIELMDVPAICFLNAVQPDEAVMEAARGSGVWIFSSPLDMYETCGRVYACLNSRCEDSRSP